MSALFEAEQVTADLIRFWSDGQRIFSYDVGSSGYLFRKPVSVARQNTVIVRPEMSIQIIWSVLTILNRYISSLTSPRLYPNSICPVYCRYPAAPAFYGEPISGRDLRRASLVTMASVLSSFWVCNCKPSSKKH